MYKNCNITILFLFLTLFLSQIFLYTILPVKKTYKLLGIDPGTNILGYAVIEINNKKLSFVDMGVIQMGALKEHQLKLDRCLMAVELN